MKVNNQPDLQNFQNLFDHAGVPFAVSSKRLARWFIYTMKASM